MGSDLKVLKTLEKDGHKIILSADPEGLKLFLGIEKGEGALDPEIVSKEILAAYPKAPVDLDVINDIVKQTNLGKQEIRRIAKGKEPTDGTDGKLLLLAKPLSTVRDPSDGAEGMKELHLFDNIEPERIIARIYHPKKGEEGMSAIGAPIKAKEGKPCNVTLGDGLTTKAVEGYDEVRSSTSGYLEKKGDAISIKEELIVNGDVDFSIGNIRFINRIRVKGNVGTGFTVRAEGDLQVDGSLGAQSKLESVSGSVTVKGFCVNAEIRAKEDISVSTLQECVLQSSRIKLQKSAIQCELRAATGVYADSASVVAGKVLSAHGINVKEAGNDVGVKTEFLILPASEISKSFDDLQNRIVQHEQAAALLKAHLGPYALKPNLIDSLGEMHRGKMKALYEKYSQVEKSRISLIAEKNKLDEGSEMDKEARISILGQWFSGAVFGFGEKRLNVTEGGRGPKSFALIEEEITLGESKPLVFEEKKK